MSDSIRSRGLLAVLVGLWLTGWALAGDPGPPQPQPPLPPFPKVPASATELPPGYPPVDNSPSSQPLRDRVRVGRPLLHWASFNSYGCTSLHARLAFVFGSCRTFYGEPALKGPPPSPLPPWVGPYGKGPVPGQPPDPAIPTGSVVPGARMPPPGGPGPVGPIPGVPVPGEPVPGAPAPGADPRSQGPGTVVPGAYVAPAAQPVRPGCNCW